MSFLSSVGSFVSRYVYSSNQESAQTEASEDPQETAPKAVDLTNSSKLRSQQRIAQIKQDMKDLELLRLLCEAFDKPYYQNLGPDEIWELRGKEIVHVYNKILLHNDVDKEIRLVQVGNDLKYQIKSYYDGKMLLEGFVYQNLNPAEMTEAIADLKTMEVVLKEDGSPKFTKPIQSWKLGKNKTVTLIKGVENQPIWDVSNEGETYTKRTYQRIPADFPGVTCPTDRCSEFTSQEIQRNIYSSTQKLGISGSGRPQRELSEEERVAFLSEDLELVSVEKNGYKKGGDLRFDANLPFKVRVEPKTVPSQFNDQVRLSKLNWAVTLIRDGGLITSEQGLGRVFNTLGPRMLVDWHAQLIIEGIGKEDERFYGAEREYEDNETGKLVRHRDKIDIRKGKKFILKADFDGSKKCLGRGEVDMVDMTEKNLRYCERSKTVKISSDVAIKTIRQIAKEYAEESPVCELNLLGANSYFAKKGQHSCYTWAREKLLDMGVVLETDPPNKDGSFSSNIVSASVNHTRSKDFFKQNPHCDDIQFV